MVDRTIANLIETFAENLAKNFNKADQYRRDKSYFDDESNIEPILKPLISALVSLQLINEEDDQIKKIKDQLISKTKTKVERGGGANYYLVGDEIETWLDEKKQKAIGWEKTEISTYRDRYFEYLKAHKSRGFESLSKTKASTLRCLQKIGNPKGDYNYSSRGLVIGPVQGGKTEHFNGLIASAFDAGYHLIIVLSGLMEDLRKQTQERIINDVIGGNDNGKPTGAELVKEFSILKGTDVGAIRVLTYQENDFNANVADVDHNLSSIKTLLVCKKNGGILKQILVYLQKHAGLKNQEIPILIVDDEADNATLNNESHKGEFWASLINKRVRAILNIFQKNAYIGYTASPFANILQHRESEREIEQDFFQHKGRDYKFGIGKSLFPRNFIELITPPPNYIGLKQLFETKEELNKVEPVFEFIEDSLHSFPRYINKKTLIPEETHIKNVTRRALKDDNYPMSLPESLISAIYCFIISVAIRKTRIKTLRDTPHYQPHNTMLIHVSVYINWQNNTKAKIDDEIQKIASKLSDEITTKPKGIYETFEKYFNQFFANSLTVGINEYLPQDYNDEYMDMVSFQDIKPLLTSTVDEIEVVALNSQTGDKLKYSKELPKTYLAIGGNRLSRGFTLEGLSVCYFIRDANYADTLLQMARWFGYRMGYLDCCKLFITNDALRKYNSISLTVEDLEETIIDLSMQPKSVTPENYALKVRTNKDVIKLTRPTMMKNTRGRRLSFENHLEQTYKFNVIEDNIDKAYKSVSRLIKRESANFNIVTEGMIGIKNATSSLVFELLDCERSFFDSNVNEIKKYIQECNKDGYLTDWCIALKKSGNGPKINGLDFGFGDININLTQRRMPLENKLFRQSAINSLLEKNPTFTAGGNSRNFIQAKDLKIAVNNPKLIEEAENKWKLENKDKNGKPKAIKESVYRELMTPQQGILIIYLIDSHEIFKDKNGNVLEGLEKKYSNFDTKNPLIGFAIGTPPLTNSPVIECVEDENIDDYVDGYENEDTDIEAILGTSE